MYRALYRKLLALYPVEFRKRFGESMLQTFDDLCDEGKKRNSGGPVFLLWLFAETLAGAVSEQVFLIGSRGIMIKNITNPMPAAIISFILALPLGLFLLIFLTEIEPLVAAVHYLFTTDGQQVNMSGRIFMLGGMALLPVAFGLNMFSLVRAVRAGEKLRAHPLNLMLGVAILFLITMTWGGLLVETVRCEVMGIPNCD